MAKFCIHCGKKLKEGEVCNCQENIKIDTSNLGNKILEIVKGIFINPIDTIKENGTATNFNMGLILSGIFALATSLFTLSLVKNAYSLIGSMMGSSYYLLSSYSVEIPYFKIFIITLLATIALIFIFTGILYLVNSIIFKGKKDFKKIFTLYSVNSVIASIALVASAIFMYINVSLGLIIVLLGFILNMVYTYKSIEFMGVKDENKHGYIYLLTQVLYYIAILIIIKMFS